MEAGLARINDCLQRILSIIAPGVLTEVPYIPVLIFPSGCLMSELYTTFSGHHRGILLLLVQEICVAGSSVLAMSTGSFDA
jgi:hypothetical protein